MRQFVLIPWAHQQHFLAWQIAAGLAGGSELAMWRNKGQKTGTELTQTISRLGKKKGKNEKKEVMMLFHFWKISKQIKQNTFGWERPNKKCNAKIPGQQVFCFDNFSCPFYMSEKYDAAIHWISRKGCQKQSPLVLLLSYGKLH